jgi:formylglycine-generating enzyme required for sulfatase activity
VGSKKPNDLGMFDIQGNAYTWCQERFLVYPPIESSGVSEDKEDAVLVVRSTDSRVLRGGSFNLPASYVRSAIRFNDLPLTRFDNFGFRLARTFTP